MIDSLRGISILSVLIYHVWPDALGIGYLGVDIFFVLSGFLASRWIFCSENLTFSTAVKYLSRRFSRLFLPLMTMVVSSWLVFRVVAPPWDVANSAADGLSAIGFFSNVWLERYTGYFEDAASLLLFLHTWSLSVEFQFYVIIFSVLLILSIVPKFGLTIIGLGTGISLFIYAYASVFHPSPGFFYSPARFWEFGLGVIAFYAVKTSRQGPKSRWYEGLFYLLPPLFIGVLVDLYLDTGAYLNYLSVAFSITILVYFYNRGDKPVKPVYRLVSFIGLFSFSLYLWHWPILKIYEFLLLRGSISGSIWSVIALFLVIFSVSYIAWRTIELGGIRERIKYSGLFIVLAASFGLMIPDQRRIEGEELGLKSYNPRTAAQFISSNFFESLTRDESSSVIIGDSYAMDLSNVLVAKGTIKTFQSFHISSRCYLSELEGQYSDEAALQQSCKSKVRSLREFVSSIEGKKVFIAFKYEPHHAVGLASLVSQLAPSNNVYVAESKRFPLRDLRKIWFGTELVPSTFEPIQFPKVAELLDTGLADSITIIDMMSALCSEDLCDGVDGFGRLISYDGYHLSPFGVRRLAATLEF